MSKIRVIGAVVDKTDLVLYREDGTTHKIKQGDPRLLPILNEITPILEANLIAEVELGNPEAKPDNTYTDHEKKTGGLTRFFRVVKSKVSAFILGEEAMPLVPVQSIGRTTLEQQMAPEPSSKLSGAIADIMAHAEPVSSETYDESMTTDEHTIVALVEDKQGNAAIVPGVENVKHQIAHANQTGNTRGMTAFLARLGKVATKRGHTVDDVLRFMKRGDLPLADDGTIIAYKVLTSNGAGMDASTFYDCHTLRVPQKVGSFVRQHESLIDPSRRTQCSTGLHIARRGYLRGFSGDIIVMVKINPEDVIAVPHGEPNKVRVSGYHIIAKIPVNEHETLRSNEAMKGTNALKLLTMAIKGEHIGITEYVTIGGASGSNVKVEPVDGANTVKPQLKKETPITQPVAPIEPPKKPVLDGPVVDPKRVAAELSEQRAAKPAAPTKADQARVLFTANKIDELKAFKKAAKKSWEVLGFSSGEITLILSENNGSPITNGQPAPEPTPEPVSVPAALTKADSKTPKELKMSGTRAEVARQLFDQAVAGDRSRWGSLWRHQKECKKSWAVLGFNAKEIERIKTNKPDWA